MERKLRCCLYTRVSTDLQKNDSQLFDLRRYAEQRDFQIVEEFSDTASGAKDSRPALNMMMDAARKRKFDAVLVWRFDRYARGTRHLLQALEEFRSLGIAFISYQENLDTGSPLGQAMFTIISALSQLERDVIRSRVVSGVRAKREKSGRWGPKRKRDDRAVIELRKEGLSVRQIAKRLGISATSVMRSLAGVPGTPSKRRA